MRQGCPPSPLIFALGMEPLAESVRSHTGIKGFEVAGSQHKINLFADDVILTLANAENSLRSASEILDRFGSLTYYKVISSKPLILAISITPRLRKSLQSISPFTCRVSSIPYLGIHITNSVFRLPPS